MEKPSKTLVTGGEGMMGSYVDFGIRVGRKELDVTDLASVLATVRKHEPKVIIHLAAETDVDRCERDPSHAYLVNSIGTYHMTVAAREVGAKLVYVSTVAVFPGTKDAYAESDVPGPKSFYGRSKYLGEVVVREELRDHLIVRAGWIFGGGPGKDKKFVGKIMAQMKEPEIRAVTDRFGSPTYAKDFIATIKKFIAEDRKGTYHVANSGGVVSRYDIAVEIAKITGSPIRVIPVDSSYFKLDAERGHSEAIMSSKIGDERSWQDALKEYLTKEWKNQ